MERRSKRYLEFGSFRIDIAEGNLLREGHVVPLTPKVFDLLQLLVENNGHTVSKNELMDRIWADAVVEDNSLTRNIFILRKTLADGPSVGSFIKTVPKRGYRFEADVHVVLEDEEELVVEKRTNYSLTLHDQRSIGATETKSLPLSLSLRSPAAVLLGAVSVAIFVLLIAWTVSRSGGARGYSAAVIDSEREIDARALDLFSRGRDLWRTRAPMDLHEATLLLEQAVEIDPNFAHAHSALADAYAFDVGNWARAEASARQAMRLDPALGEPYASVGFVELFWKWNPAEAERSFRKAVSLSPDYATAHQWYAIKLAIDGQFNEALTEIDKAAALEPRSAAINADLCKITYFLQRYDEAEVHCLNALTIEPDFVPAYAHLHDIYVESGMHRRAVEAFLKSEQLSLNTSTVPEHLKILSETFEKQGIRGFWRARLRLTGSSDPRGYSAAKYYARLGEKDKALATLRRAFDNRDFEFPFFYSDPAFLKCCAADPRFRELQQMWATPNSESTGDGP